MYITISRTSFPAKMFSYRGPYLVLDPEHFVPALKIATRQHNNTTINQMTAVTDTYRNDKHLTVAIITY